MNLLKIKEKILAFSVIISLIAPFICTDITYAIDATDNENQAQNEEMVEPKTEEQKGSEQKSSEEENNGQAENAVEEGKDTVEDEATENTANESEEGKTEEDEEVDNGVALMSVEQDLEGVPATISEPAPVAEGPQEIEVYAGTGTLQKAINDAKDGDTLILFGGNYYNNGPITINKSITIKGTGNIPYIYEELQIKETNKEDKIILEGFSSGMFRVKNEFDYIDIQSPVNLTVKNLILRGVGGSLEPEGKRPSLINIENTANETKLTIESSEMMGYGDGLRVMSSNTTVDVSGSSYILADTTIRIENGSNNTFNIKQSKLSGYSYISREDEAISIVEQSNLNINIEDCEIKGSDAGGSANDVATKLFSIDDEGDTHSTNVKIKITGNSVITEEDKGDNNCIFNFGPNNTPEDNITAHVDAGVIFPSEKVSNKYNNTDDKDYVVVGIYDRYENGVFGNLDVKTYKKDQVITEVQNYEQKNEEGHRFDKWLYKDNTEVITDFNEPFEATVNMDVFPKYVETVDVKIDDKTYTIDKEKSLNDLEQTKKDEAKAQLEKIKQDLQDTFTEFVDTVTGEKFKTTEDVMQHQFLEDTEIIAVNDIVITVGGKTFEIKNASNKTLETLANENHELKTVLDELKTVEGKDFSKFVDENGTEVKESETRIIKDTVLTPKYTVKVKIKKDGNDAGREFTLEENQTLDNLEQDGKDLIQEIESIEEKDFKHFVDVDGTVVSEDMPITKHTELTAKYTVKITIKKNTTDTEGKTYTLDEGQCLADLTETEKSEWREYIKGTDKEFIWFNEIENDQTPINKHITLTPKYNVVITIKAVKGDERFTIEEGKKLADIEDQERYENAKKKDNRTFSRFVYTDENGVEQTFDVENTTITKDITLTPKFNVKVTINKADGTPEEFYIEENQKLVDIKQDDKDRFEQTKQKGNRTFSRFVYTENGVEKTFDVENTEIKDNITLNPKFNLKVTINGTDYDLEEGLTLNDLGQDGKKALDDLKNVNNKVFKNYLNESNNVIGLNDAINENITIHAEYNVVITIGNETIEIPEGQKLSELSAQDKEKMDNIVNKTNKQFAKFKEIDDNTPITENMELTPIYNVTVTIGEGNIYTIEENQTLTDLFAQYPDAKQDYEDLKAIENRPFSEFTDQFNKTIEENTPITENTILIPKYLVTVTVKDKDGNTEQFYIEEGKTLNDLSDEEKAKLEEIKNDHNEGERFARFVNSATGEAISENDIIDGDVTIEPTYEAIPVTPEEPKQDENNSENGETEKVEDSNSTNPKTVDNIFGYVKLAILGIVCIIVSKKLNKRKKR